MIYATYALVPLSLIAFVAGCLNEYRRVNYWNGAGYCLYRGNNFITNEAMHSIALSAGAIAAASVLLLYFVVIAVLRILWFAKHRD
jgi:hypothetical protein